MHEEEKSKALEKAKNAEARENERHWKKLREKIKATSRIKASIKSKYPNEDIQLAWKISQRQQYDEILKNVYLKIS